MLNHVVKYSLLNWYLQQIAYDPIDKIKTKYPILALVRPAGNKTVDVWLNYQI